MISLARDEPINRQPLGAAATGDHPEEHLGQAELGVFGADPQIAGQGQLQPSAQGVAVDGGDRRPGHLGQGAEGAGEAGSDRVGPGSFQLDDVGPGGEDPAPAPQDDGTRRIGRQLLGHGEDLPQHGPREGVGFGPVKADHGHAIASSLQRHESVGHQGHRI
jgi:hypothetical protein